MSLNNNYKEDVEPLLESSQDGPTSSEEPNDHVGKPSSDEKTPDTPVGRPCELIDIKN